jgi:O-succinylbenzoate synthase
MKYKCHGFPLQVLHKILNIISEQINNTKKGVYIPNKDGSCVISNYTFVEYPKFKTQM